MIEDRTLLGLGSGMLLFVELRLMFRATAPRFA